MKSIITLTTDFGTKDGFVGQMKGVILGINPLVNIIDVTHDITPYAVGEAAIVVKGVIERFQFPSIHIAVVDPGVGGQRKSIAIRWADTYLIGPDNGIFSYLLKEKINYEARCIDNPDFTAPIKSATFHGRDIFAPAAAWLSAGSDFEKIGPVIPEILKLDMVEIEKSGHQLKGQIIHVDRFGNLITNIEGRDINYTEIEIDCGEISIKGLSNFYSQSNPNSPIALINSFDLLEISLFQDDASKKFGAKVGDEVRVMVKSDSL